MDDTIVQSPRKARNCCMLLLTEDEEVLLLLSMMMVCCMTVVVVVATATRRRRTRTIDADRLVRSELSELRILLLPNPLVPFLSYRFRPCCCPCRLGRFVLSFWCRHAPNAFVCWLFSCVCNLSMRSPLRGLRLCDRAKNVLGNGNYYTIMETVFKPSTEGILIGKTTNR